MKTKSKKRTKVAKDLISGFQELADALEAGSDLSEKFTCYQIELDLKPERFAQDDVRHIRRLLNASQSVFAMFLGASPQTVRDWEQGRSTPSGVASRFLDEIRRNPDHYRERLKRAVVPKANKVAMV